MKPNPPPVPKDSAKTRGIFRKMFLKLDDSMKRKAEEKAREGTCCGDDKKGGGKCC